MKTRRVVNFSSALIFQENFTRGLHPQAPFTSFISSYPLAYMDTTPFVIKLFMLDVIQGIV